MIYGDNAGVQRIRDNRIPVSRDDNSASPTLRPLAGQPRADDETKPPPPVAQPTRTITELFRRFQERLDSARPRPASRPAAQPVCKTFEELPP